MDGEKTTPKEMADHCRRKAREAERAAKVWDERGERGFATAARAEARTYWDWVARWEGRI